MEMVNNYPDVNKYTILGAITALKFIILTKILWITLQGKGSAYYPHHLAETFGAMNRHIR